jgi:hypothetical protein
MSDSTEYISKKINGFSFIECAKSHIYTMKIMCLWMNRTACATIP